MNIAFLHMKEEELKKKIADIEEAMQAPDFWNDKEAAQKLVREHQDLKLELESGGKGGKYDKGDAVLTVFGGAGGDDAEDFAAMLVRMYLKYFEKQGFSTKIL